MANKGGICQPDAAGASPALADFAQSVLKNYFNTFQNVFLTKHHIDSYESFVFREMPEIIFSENPITILSDPIEVKDANGEPRISGYKYKTDIYIGGKNATTPEELELDIGAPTITLDSGKTVRRMFPNEARIRNLTYAATIRAKIEIDVQYYTPAGPKTTTIALNNYPLLRLPILLRSKLCATHRAGRNLLYEMGECRNDQGGYFIIDGSEKVLITRQEKAVNTVIVRLYPEHNADKLYTSVNVGCQHPKTKHTRVVNIYRHQSQFDTALKIEDGAIRVHLPGIIGGIPLFIVFRALGLESDRDIVRMILPDISSPNIKNMEATLIPSIHDAWPCLTTEQAIEYLRLLSRGFIIEAVLKILHDELFAHVPDEPLTRAQYLAETIRKMIRVEMRMEPAPSRDDTRNQRLLPTGTLIRVLFTGAWNTWKKNVVMTIDKQFNYNKTVFEGENFLNMFNQGNLSNVLSTQALNDALMRGFRGKWGTDEWNMKKGVIQPLARISYLDSMSHTRRVVSDFDTGSKLTGPRHLNPSQIGYFCTAETPTGGHIGATKNLSILTAISVYIQSDKLVEWLFTKGGVRKVISVPTHELARGVTSVQINGGTIGFTHNPGPLTLALKHMKWTACIPPTTSISFNTADNIIRIYMDDGRPLRPLYHLDRNAEGKAIWPRRFAELKERSWTHMVCGTYEPTQRFGIMSAAMIDPLAQNPQATLEDYVRELHPHIGCVEYMDPYESNEAYVSWWGNTADLAEHTHAEIHPCSLMGLLANMVPYSNHNQAPRNQLSCSQSKQGIGYYATNYENRFDTYGSMLCYGEGALCRTIIFDAVANGEMPYGTNIIFCLNSFSGYNQDDGIIFNRSSIERGLFRSLAFRSYECVEEIDPISKMEYRIGNPKNVLAWSDLRPGHDFTQLDERGIIKEGSLITDKSVLVGRYLLDPETKQIKDASVIPTVFTSGRVDKVVVLHQANGMRLIRIRIFEERVPELGDKFSSRHGQKGTIGMLMDAVDMPRLPSGIVPDVMVNPHCIPSRMTVAQMLEQVFGRLGAEVGAKINATTFMNDDQSLKSMGDALEAMGLHRTGEEIAYSGITGKMYTTSVFMGPLQFMRIKHLVSDKLNARGAGRREQRTHQPTGGRGNEGGMRMGEMERDVLIAHGAAKMLEESYTTRSDGTDFWICNGCGTIPIYNESNRLFVCPMCDGPVSYQGNTSDTIGLVLPTKKSRTTFSRVHMPYALKLMDQEMTTYMNGGLRFITEKHARRFREPADLKLADIKDDKDDLLGVQIGALQEQMDMMGAENAVRATPAAPALRPEDDAGHADSPADSVDIGQPESNNSPGANNVPIGGRAIEFNGKSTKYKEFGTYFPMKLVIEGKMWPTVEHYFQAMKYVNNPVYQEEIRKAKTPAAAKKLGKSAEATMREDWNTNREAVMMTANKEKFSDRHPQLKQLLIDTGDAILLNASPQDNFWGIGRKRQGRNKLGKILMQLRGELAPAALVAPPMDANERIIATNIPAAPEPAEQQAAAMAPAPVVNIQVVNQQPETTASHGANALNVAAAMLENQGANLSANAPAAPLENQAGSANSGPPVLMIDEGIEAEELPELPQQVVAATAGTNAAGPGPGVADPGVADPGVAGPGVAGPDNSQIKVVTVNAAPPSKN
jgi:DNA-directed RNA polymerase II subunit RPB2